MAKWTKVYGKKPQLEWMHLLRHTLDVIPMNWYIKMELHHGTSEWDIMCEGFMLTFSFEDGWGDSINEELQEIKEAIFRIPQEPLALSQPKWATQLSCTLECYNVTIEEVFPEKLVSFRSASPTKISNYLRNKQSKQFAISSMYDR